MLKIVTKKQKHIIDYKGALFTVIPNSKEDQKKIVEKHEYIRKIKTGAGLKDQYEPDHDYLGIQVDNIISQVVAWEGIADDLECNDENKRSLAIQKENEHICVFIQQEIMKIGEAEAEEEAEEIKN